MLRLGMSAVSAGLIAMGALLLIVGLISSSPGEGIRTILSLVIALIAAYFLIRVGRGIWRELREPQPPDRQTNQQTKVDDEVKVDDFSPPEE